MKNQTMKFQPYHLTSGADAALVTKKRVTSCLFGLLLVGLAVPGFGQIEPARPTVRPIPGAPKRSYVPASFSAQPGLQCKIPLEARPPQLLRCSPTMTGTLASMPSGRPPTTRLTV